MLVLDTSSVSPADRADAFQGSVSANCTTSLAIFEDPNHVRAEVHFFDLGPAKVLNIEASGTTLRRTPRMARGMNECPIALALPMKTNNRMMWAREDRLFESRDLILVDLSAPYVYGWSGDGASYAFHVEFEQLDLPMDTINAAARHISHSPIYPLVRDHISRVMTDAGTLVHSGTATQIAAASIELMRALIVSAAGDTRRLSDTMQTSMLPRVQAYVSHHLREPDLCPAGIATANGISIRAVYKIYETLGVSLEQSIIEQRLHGAKDDLANLKLAERSIAATARAWGFVNQSFFSSRFRLAFGITPMQWRSLPRSTSVPLMSTPD